MNGRVEALKAKIATLREELVSLSPGEDLSVRELARRAGISPATAQRFKTGKTVDIPTAKKLMAAKLITICPCCGRQAWQP